MPEREASQRMPGKAAKSMCLMEGLRSFLRWMRVGPLSEMRFLEGSGITEVMEPVIGHVEMGIKGIRRYFYQRFLDHGRINDIDRSWRLVDKNDELLVVLIR